MGDFDTGDYGAGDDDRSVCVEAVNIAHQQLCATRRRALAEERMVTTLHSAFCFSQFHYSFFAVHIPPILLCTYSTSPIPQAQSPLLHRLPLAREHPSTAHCTVSSHRRCVKIKTIISLANASISDRREATIKLASVFRVSLCQSVCRSTPLR